MRAAGAQDATRSPQPTLRASRSQPTLKSPTLKPTLSGSGSAATLKAAGSATLKTSGNTTLRKLQEWSVRNVDTVWDEPQAPNTPKKKIAALTSHGPKISACCATQTRMKEDKKRMIDDMHAHTLERVEATRTHTERLLEEVAAHIREFTREFERRLASNFDDLDAELRARMTSINARYARLYERASTLQGSIEEETASRLRETEEVLRPIRQQVEEASKELEKEEAIRRNKIAEQQRRLEASVALLEESCKSEEESGRFKLDETVKECTEELARLKTRQAQCEAGDQEQVEELQKEFVQEQRLRHKGQDRVAQQITDFIARFQAHAKEEAEMGN